MILLWDILPENMLILFYAYFTWTCNRLQISSDELSSIITRAKIWRGAQGSTRKVVVSEYEEKGVSFVVQCAVHNPRPCVYLRPIRRGVCRDYEALCNLRAGDEWKAVSTQTLPYAPRRSYY